MGEQGADGTRQSGRRYAGRLAEAARDLACKDELTGLFNRRLLNRLLDEWWPELMEGQGEVAVLVLDLDRFKEVNDLHGHLAGDEVLRTTAVILRHAFRGSDVVARWGGDEFVVVLPGAAATEAGALGERARAALAAWTFTSERDGSVIDVPVSLSLGVATAPEDGASGREVLAAADRRLYAEKEARNPGRRARRLQAALAAGAAGALLAGVLVVGWVVATSAPPPAPLASAREVELARELDVLRRELAAVTAAERRASRPGADRGAELAVLQARIRELSDELDDVRTRPAPTPAPPEPTVPAEPPIPTPEPPPPPTEVPERVAAPVVTPPVLRHFEQPAYPEVALRLRREAVVEVRVLVNAEGRVVEAEPEGAPTAFGFEREARRAALRAVYSPGTRDGVPVQMQAILAVQFRLGDPRP